MTLHGAPTIAQAANNKTIFNMALRDKIPAGEKVVADGMHRLSTNPTESDKTFALPNLCESKELGNFKTSLCYRHEGFNGRIRCFKASQDTHHNAKKHHKDVFEAICVMVIWQMDHGRPLFSAH